MSTIIPTKDAFAFAELLEILSFIEKEYVNKIPKKMMDIFKNNAYPDYKNHLDPTIPLEKQNIAEETSTFLAILTVNYWCNSEEEKKELLDAYAENEKQYQDELREKYNPDKLFETSTKEAEAISSENNNILENSETTTSISNLPLDYLSFPWYRKIFTRIRNFVYKLFRKEKNPN